MADTKPTAGFYDNLGGINQKASEYAVGRAQFLSIFNMDFDVPNALNKRPGSTLATTGQAASGPINSLFEFVKLTGESYVVYGSDTAMFYLAVNTPALLDTGWTNGQPTDMLTFVNKLWMCNGQKYEWWSGTSLYNVGLPIQPNRLNPYSSFFSGPAFSVFGVTQAAASGGATVGTRAILWASYAYVRGDGYISPLDIVSKAIPVSPNQVSVGNAVWHGITGGNYGGALTLSVTGFTAPAIAGVTALAVFLAMDQFSGLSGTLAFCRLKSGDFSYGTAMKAETDPTVFNFFTLIPLGTTQMDIAGVTLLWSDMQATYAPFSLMQTDFFSTYTPKYIEVNQNFMFMSGFSAAPSSVTFSELGEPEVVDPEHTFEVRTNDGDQIYGQKAYNNYILVFKETSFHKIIGDSAENLQLIQLSDQYGCISNKTILEFNEKLVWLDRKGIMQFDGAGWRIISGPVEDTFRRLNVAVAKEKACAAHWPDRNQIWFGIPIDASTKNNLTVVWDYLVDAWTFFDGFNAAAFAPVKGYNSRSSTWRGDYSGMIYYHGDSFYGDNGQGISCTIRPHWDKWQGEHSTNIWRRFFLDVNTATGLTGQITGKVFSNYDNSTVRATFAMYQNQFQTRAEMGVPGKAVTAEIAHFSASLPLQINGYSWAKRNLRNV